MRDANGFAIPKRLIKHDGLKVAHRHAPKHEKTTAKRLGGRLTNGSGNQREKGDVRVDGIMRVELKCTEKASFSVTKEMWRKISEAAAQRSEIPAMEIRFLNPDGSVSHQLALVPTDVLDRLIKVSS
jgi:hypothetical protein